MSRAWIWIIVILAIASAGIGAYYSAGKNKKANIALTADVTATFNCDESKTITAVFHNNSGGSVDLTLSDSRKVSLPQTISANGARYANANETIVFWNVGDTATLSENGQTTFDNCVQAS